MQILSAAANWSGGMSACSTVHESYSSLAQAMHSRTMHCMSEKPCIKQYTLTVCIKHRVSAVKMPTKIQSQDPCVTDT